MKLVLLGPPGAGKGTLAGQLKDLFGISHISTGDILREELKKNTSIGQEVKGYIDNGELVPDEVVTKMIEQKLSSKNQMDKGFMLDGFPRTKQQAEDLDEILERIGNNIDFAVYLECSLPVIVHRLTGRRVCKKCGALYHMENKKPKQGGICDVCGGELYQRPDDNEETIKTRLEVYEKSTRPIIEFYEAKGKLKKLDADQNADQMQVSLMKLFDENGKHNQH